MRRWAIDIGTSNTALSWWRDDLGRPEILALPEISRHPVPVDPLQSPRVIPSAVHVVEDPDFWTRVTRRRPFAGRVYWGREAWIGRQALERNLSSPRPGYVPTFKPWLGRASTAPLARTGNRVVTARDAARWYLRELFAEVYRQTGERIRDLTVTAPVEAYESYRAELRDALRSLGVSRLSFVDEPVAAAVGYGLGLHARRRVLVVDFGAGTLDLAFCGMSGHQAEKGECHVLAKAGVAVGGDHVDAWLVDDVIQRTGLPKDIDDPFWRRVMVDEARRVKEGTYIRGEEVFHVVPPGRGAFRHGAEPEPTYTQSTIREVLDRHRLFERITACLDEVARAGRDLGHDLDAVDDVLMVGGSTLLPGVYPLFEERFGRDRVRAWQPFEAVSFGAAAVASGRVGRTDHLVHDYAILLYDPASGDEQYLPIIRRGTRIPTNARAWTRHLVPTCAHGEPETWFKLVICEMGSANEDERLFGWDAEGDVHTLDGGETRLIVPLNAHEPTLGALEPPHSPSDRTPRLDVAFGVDEDRWLLATIRDLKTGRVLMDEQAVVRLM